ncbi:hypothetical protein SGLAM104S_06918 [Streptomyces glaucescens]
MLFAYGSGSPDPAPAAAYVASRLERLQILLAHRPNVSYPTFAAKTFAAGAYRRHRCRHHLRGHPRSGEGRVRQGGPRAVRREGLLRERGDPHRPPAGPYRRDHVHHQNGLRHQAAQPASGTVFLGEYHRLDVGFAFKKGSPLTKAFQAAVNRLIEDGTYAPYLAKSGTTASAIDASRINPPEHR